jgi:hypothetical protein
VLAALMEVTARHIGVFSEVPTKYLKLATKNSQFPNFYGFILRNGRSHQGRSLRRPGDSFRFISSKIFNNK